MSEVDMTGLKCPLPVLKARKMLKSLEVGDELRVLATDPSAPGDFAAFCAEAGHELVESGEEDGLLVVLIRKGGE
ncbi:MAG: sulfurtransferase TusA family protein [Rhodospirillales bacterium]|nr:sulfurtransferase TusA family protein [Rhodospirillales bacterium]